MVAWRHAESLPVAERALAVARSTGAREAEVRALTVIGGDLAYLGRSEEGLRYFRRAQRLAEEIGDRVGLERAYLNLTDTLTMLGRPRDSARVAQAALEVVRRYGIESTILVSNAIEALSAIGDWDEAERVSAAALRGINTSFRYWLLTIRAELEIGRGAFDAARSHLEAALKTLREDHVHGIFDAYVAELALWEHRWTDAERAVGDALANATSAEDAQLRAWFSAKGLRAHAELAAVARARRDGDAAATWLGGADELVDVARRAAAGAAAVTPNAGGWLAIAEAEHERAHGTARPESWSDAATAWERLERPPLAAYCRWREAEALVAAGASRVEASVPLREAYAVADRIGAKPLVRELELLAQRARLDLTSPDVESDEEQSMMEILGLTTREAEVLSLVARGFTDREIAEALVISIKTASVHVSHILGKLGVTNRREAAAVAHRLASPPVDA
jgi:DNA-binding CsgD family transcriptional regulator/tetratricopeptide (TPR) repeat protein